MPKLPVLSGREVNIRVKRKAIVDVDRTRTTIVPNHKEIDRGTLSELIMHAGLTREEFMRLL